VKREKGTEKARAKQGIYPKREVLSAKGRQASWGKSIKRVVLKVSRGKKRMEGGSLGQKNPEPLFRRSTQKGRFYQSSPKNDKKKK